MLFEREFYDHLQSTGNSDETVRIYHQIIARLKAFLGARGIDDVRQMTEAEVDAFTSDLGRQHLASQTGYHLLCHLKRYFAYLEEAGIVYLSPAAELCLPKNIRHHHRAYAEEEIRTMLDGLRVDTPLCLRGKAILELGYSSALRPREIRTLRLGDIDFRTGKLFIDQAKGRKDRIVPVGETALKWVSRYLCDVRSPGTKSQAHDTVFISLVTGRPLSPRGLAVAVSEVFIRSGFKPIPLYSIRATAATNLLDRGMNVVHIGRLLGHSSMGTTQIYLHTKRRALERVLAAAHPRYRMTNAKEESDDDP